jgi:Dna[CI] antecedent, DciA
LRKVFRRTPKNYDGTGVTTHKVSDVLPIVLSQIGEAYHDRPDLILASWPDIIGPKLSVMTHAVSFCEGILTVKVKNSTLHRLLSRHDKPRILASLRQRFPKVYIQNIVFRI